MVKKEQREFNSGDIVEFKKVKRIVLNRVTMASGVEICHIFHPERGVFSAYPDELKYVGHLDEWEKMLEAFESIVIKKSA